MSIFEFFENFAIAENMFGIYRNIRTINKKYYIPIFLHIGLELVFSFVNRVMRTICLLKSETLHFDDKLQNIIYLVLSYFDTAIIILSGIHNAKFTQQFFMYVRELERKNQNQIEIKCILKRMQKSILIHVPGFIALCVFFVPTLITDDCPNFSSPLCFSYIFVCLFIEVRFFMKVTSCTFSLITISGFLQSIASSITDVRRSLMISVKLEEEKKRNLHHMYAMQLRQMNDCIDSFRYIEKLTFLLKKTYALEMLITLLFAVISLTVLMYRFATIYFKASDIKVRNWTVMILIVDFVGLTVFSVQGQLVTQKYWDLRRNVARYYHELSNASSVPVTLVKSASNMCSLMAENPISITLPFSQQVGLSLLPAFVNFATERIVFGLQANHVI